MTEVNQADRDAAARWAKSNSRHAQAANIRRGSCDTAPLVQAFARHAAQARREEREALIAFLSEPPWPYRNEHLISAIRRGEHLLSLNGAGQ